jgi:excinuclease ABC subunit C
VTLDEAPILPTQPGVYIFRTPAGRVIYVGKAKNIKSRIGQHFKSPGKSSRITRDAGSLETIVTQNEVEALVLEANLIKQHRPRYNVLLKDDKHYPFLKITKETYPMLVVTRKVVKDGGKYYGPYPDSRAVWRAKNLIDNTFALRKNSGIPFTPKKRPCLNFHMKRCLAPCVGYATPELYAEAVSDVVAVLEGKADDVLQKLREAMREAAQNREFELAAGIRDRVQAVEKLFGSDHQVALNTGLEDMDFLGVAQAGEYAMVQHFQMRSGRVIGRDKRFLTGAEESSEEEILKAFMQDYYAVAMQVPPLVLVPVEFEDATAWEEFISKGRKVELRHPQALKEVLALPERPWRIEGYDNSNLFGTHIVSGMVVFEGGRARKGEHRRFKVKGLDHPDDYTSMKQTVLRRFTGSLSEKLPMPDLLMIDGGRGQVNAALDALREAGVQVPVVGLAKREETLILPSIYGAQWWLTSGSEIGKNREVRLLETHPALRMMIAVRDEVHHFAITYHRKLRAEAMLKSVFDDVPGIGEKRKEALLEHFTSLEEIRAASLEQIAGVPGIGANFAKVIQAHFAQTAGG